MKPAIDQQLKHNDCGISAVKIIYNLHKISISREFIEENIYLNESGSDIQDIKDFLDKQHFDTDYNILDLNTLKYQEQKLKEYLPCILPVKSRNGLHYVVINNVSKSKVEVLDPAVGQKHKWSFGELIKYAQTTTAQYDLVKNQSMLAHIIKEELTEYGIEDEGMERLDKAEVINKLTYFTYVKENFGFAHKQAEKDFLIDLIRNQDVNLLPRQFRAMKLNSGKLKVKAPVVLTVKMNNNAGAARQGSEPAERPRKTYWRLLSELKQYNKLWIIYIVSAIFAALLVQLTVFSNQILIDNILPDLNSNLLIVFAIGFGVFKLFNLLLYLYKSFIAVHLANILDNYFLTSFVEKLNTYSIRYIHTYSRGDLTERIKDSLLLKSFFIRFFTKIVIDAFVTVYSLLILFLINWKVTLVVVAVLLLVVLWFKIITPYLRENEKRRFLEKSNLFSAIFENIDGLQVIKSFRMEGLFMQRLAPKISNILQIQRRVRLVSLVNNAVMDVIMIAASLLILVFISLDAINHQAVSIGQIITYIALSYQIFSSIDSLLEENLELQENEIILNRYFDFGKTQVRSNNSGGQMSKITHFYIHKIEFQNIVFHYTPQKPVFSKLQFEICRGEKIKLEGGNGTGKSTLCKLLSLLYLPDEGDILINDEKQYCYNANVLRKKILLVSNEDILFNDSIGFNIAFDDHAKISDLLELSRETGLHEFIAEKEDGLGFIINEQGRNLSTGQRKKILLMRALFSDAEVLILDETFSGIDKESTERIENYINLQTERAFIIVSHEPLNHLIFSKTLMMHDGRIEQLRLQRL